MPGAWHGYYQGPADLTLLAWRRHPASWVPALPASLAGPVPGFWPAVGHAVNYAWIVVFLALVLGQYRTARIITALAVAADVLFLVQAQFAGVLLRPLSSWSSFILFDLTPVLAMAAFHRDAPPAARRPWLLAAPGYYLLVPVPVMVIQATGNHAWQPPSRWSPPTPPAPSRPRPHRHRIRTRNEQTTAYRRRTQDMPFQPSPRPASVLASVLAAGLTLTAASCSRLTPLGPAAPQPSQLRSPFVLEALGIQDPTPTGGCPAGSVALSGGPGQCYRPLGAPVTITSAAISPVSAIPQNRPPGTAASPPAYGFMITLPASGMPALTAVTTTAADAQGYLGITVAGRTRLPPR